jgi:hypothetical protein
MVNSIRVMAMIKFTITKLSFTHARTQADTHTHTHTHTQKDLTANTDLKQWKQSTFHICQ